MRVRSVKLGMLATKIVTRENYIVTVPNAVVVSGENHQPQRPKQRSRP
ncbi:Uncharacterised protein [Raoultella ornithinolytica]|nr:Uncharacterised protein [Raoultella ornithinolytica]